MTLRGVRIELGEIESALRTQPEVADAVVLLREDTPGEPKLVAYVRVGEPDGAPPLTDAMQADLRHLLRARLGGQLPAHLVPSRFVVVDSVPRTVHGKVDRSALPAPEPCPEDILPAPRPMAKLRRTPAEVRR